MRSQIIHATVFSVSLAITGLLLSSCADQAQTPTSDSGSPSQSSSLQNYQSIAKLVLLSVKTEVSNYESTHSVPADTRQNLDQAIADLTTAVNNFAALSSTSNYTDDAQALLNVLLAINSNLPAGVISSETQADISDGIQAAQILLGIVS